MKRALCALALAGLTASGACAAELAQSGKGMTIWFDAGGSVGEPYATTVVNGALQAAADTGCDLKVVYSDWAPEKMLENFKNGLANKADGFVVMGHPGDEAFAPLIDQAFAQGALVTCVDTALPSLQEKYAARGFGYIGTDNWRQGEAMAKELLRRTNLKEGDRVFLWGIKSLEQRGRRARAMTEVFEKAKLKVDFLEISPEISKDVSLGAPVLAGYLSSHPDCKMVVVDHGALTGQLGNFLKAAGLGPDAVYGAGFSLTPATVAAIQSGYVDLVSEAQPYLMGYLSVIGLVQTHKYSFAGLNVDTGGGFISADNIEQIAPLANAGMR